MELSQLLAMLDRAKCSYGTRDDYNPDGTAVLIECNIDDDDWYVAEFGFDYDGKLKNVRVYEGEED